MRENVPSLAEIGHLRAGMETLESLREGVTGELACECLCC